ncbi:hypothetical protein NIES4103_25440 [Nostoc sp. NIES-4103]|nr:hypothetical protein NIES4103_25440 [Nostoc sp. NIES-4103]
MNLQEQNWTNLFGNYTLEDTAWYGTWTLYSLSQEVINSFQCVRSFRTNEDKTLIFHKNNYIYSDGSTEEKSWQLEKQTCNQPDGLVHSSIPSMRALSFSEGASAWLSKTLEPEKKFGVELFFLYNHWRTSVAIIYAENHETERITHIREHLGSFTVEPPGSEVKEIDGQWIGKKQYMAPDLKISDTEPIPELILDPTKAINKTVFLPDGVVVNTPENLEIGQEFQIVAGRFVSPTTFKRLTAKYNVFGNFELLVSEVFHRQFENK